MTSLAPTLEAFFTDRLHRERHASPNTVAAYRDSLRLLLRFTHEQIGKQPSNLELSDLDAPLVGAFLDHLEHERGNTVRTRNARLAAVHSLFRFAALRHPEHAALVQRVLAIPEKRGDHTQITYLTPAEIDALLHSPDRTRWIGRRDHALLLVAVQTGLRVSELTGLRRGDVALGAGAHVRCCGKGRKERAHRSPRKRSQRCTTGLLNGAAGSPTRCSPPAGEASSAATQSGASSPNTPTPPTTAARRCGRRRSRPMC